MKIISGKFREDLNLERWIKFRKDEYKYCNLVFLRRLAALCRDFNHPMNSIIGYRDIAQQQALYNEDLRKNGGKPSGKVAKPGNSWHEFGFAVDLNDDWWELFSNLFWMPYPKNNQGLNAFGLYLPLNRIDSPSVLEWWHVQPIETLGYTGVRSQFAAPDDAVYGKPATIRKGSTGIWVTELCRLLKASIVSTFNDDISAKTLAVQKEGNLVQDGIVGPKTWAYLYSKSK